MAQSFVTRPFLVNCTKFLVQHYFEGDIAGWESIRKTLANGILLFASSRFILDNDYIKVEMDR